MAGRPPANESLLWEHGENIKALIDDAREELLVARRAVACRAYAAAERHVAVALHLIDAADAEVYQTALDLGYPHLATENLFDAARARAAAKKNAPAVVAAEALA